MDDELRAEYNAQRNTSNNRIVCHAPFTSINFEQSGKATACCYNRRQVLGRFPEDTVAETWFGESSVRLRREMQKGRFPRGCDLCFHQYRSRNFSGMKARDYDLLADSAYPEDAVRFANMPKVMEFEISNTCNLECGMCSGYFSSAIRNNRERLPALASPYNEQFVAQVESFIPFLREARFLGGEPFLIGLYYRIWRAISLVKPDIQVSITTNGTILNGHVRKALSGLAAHIIVSIDSLRKNTFERIRAGAEFEQVMEHLDFFREYTRERKTSLTVAICPMQENWDEIPDFLEFCNRRDMFLCFNTVFRPVTASLKALSGRELDDIVSFWEEARGETRSRVEEANRARYADLIRQVRQDREMALQSDGYIDEESRREHRRLLGLYEDEFATEGDKTLGVRKDAVVSEILRRFAHERGAPVEYDDGMSQEDAFCSERPAVFYAAQRLAREWERMAQGTRTDDFIVSYFRIVEIVARVLVAGGVGWVKGTLAEKIGAVSKMLLCHPRKELIIRAMATSDTALVMRVLNDLSLDQIRREIVERYGQF